MFWVYIIGPKDSLWKRAKQKEVSGIAFGIKEKQKGF